MSDPALPVSEAVEAAFRASVALAAAMGGNVRLYDGAAPTNAPFPYLVLGEVEVNDDATECLDSTEVYVPVHVFARVAADRKETGKQAKRIAALVRSLMRDIDTIPGYDVVISDFESARHFFDTDGLTAHSINTHRFLLDPI